MLIATDLDGTFGKSPDAQLCISGRTWAEYDHVAKAVAARMPLYIRGTGQYGDRIAAGLFKLQMCSILGVTRYYEDDSAQASILLALPGLEVCHPNGMRW